MKLLGEPQAYLATMHEDGLGAMLGLCLPDSDVAILATADELLPTIQEHLRHRSAS